jgi:cell division protein ZapA
MPTVELTISNRSYRLACGEGQEPQLRDLALYVNGRLEELAKSLRFSGANATNNEPLLKVMLLLSLADEAQDAKAEVITLRQELAKLQNTAAANPDTQAIRKMVERVEKLAAA